MEQNNCNHPTSTWKKMKKAVIDCESMDLDSRAYLGTGYELRCDKCKKVLDTKFEANKKGKKLKLKMNN